MRTAIFAASAVALAAIATPAFAQDDDKSFTGPRADVIVGWDHVGSGVGSATIKDDGVVYGGSLGYDHQIGKLVLGVEGEATGATTGETVHNVLTPGDSASNRAGRDLYAGARLGVALSPRAMIYAKGGYTNARITNRYVSGTTTTTGNDTFDGWRLGAGAEVKLTDKVYVKGEYRYSQYDRIHGTNFDVNRQQVVGGVGIRF